MKEQQLKRHFATLQLNDGVLFRDFRKCFTHISVYEGKNDFKNPGNSRYVFLGMYAFQGYLAELITTHISGNGKQLQYYLGNVFCTERFAALADELGLENCVTLHEKLDYDKLKHIFTQALLGFIQQHATEEFKQDFAFQHFLKDSASLLPKTHKINAIQALKARMQQVLNKRISFRHSDKIDDDRTLYSTQVVLSSGVVIGEHESVSKTYAKKKAIKNALRYVLEKEAETPEFERFAEKSKSLITKRRHLKKPNGKNNTKHSLPRKRYGEHG